MKYKNIITANSGEDTLSIINFEDKIKTKNIELNKLSPKKGKLRPSALVLDDNKNILLINSWDNSLFKINLKEEDLLNYINVGKYPISISLFKDKIYVLNSDSSSISIIDKKEFINIENIFIDGYLTDMEVDIINEKVYIVNWERNTISIIDIVSGEIKNIDLPFKPLKIIIEDEYLFVLSFLDNKYTNYCNLSKLNLKNYKITRSIKIKGIFYDFSKIPNEDKFVLIDAQRSYIFELNYKSKSIINERYIGGLQSEVLTDNDQIYVNDLINNKIIILDINNYKIINKIRVGKEPQGIFLL